MAFNGKEFLLGIQHLDASRRALFCEHGGRGNGRLALVEQLVDEAMESLAAREKSDVERPS